MGYVQYLLTLINHEPSIFFLAELVFLAGIPGFHHAPPELPWRSPWHSPERVVGLLRPQGRVVGEAEAAECGRGRRMEIRRGPFWYILYLYVLLYMYYIYNNNSNNNNNNNNIDNKIIIYIYICIHIATYVYIYSRCIYVYVYIYHMNMPFITYQRSFLPKATSLDPWPRFILIYSAVSTGCWKTSHQATKGYPLVNIQKTMENHHFQWVNPL